MDDSAGTKGTPRKTTKKKQYPEAEEIIRRWENGRGNKTDRKITPDQVREFAEKPQKNAGKSVIESRSQNSQLRKTGEARDTGALRKTGSNEENAREQQRKAAERGAQEAKKYAERQKKYEKAFGGRR